MQQTLLCRWPTIIYRSNEFLYKLLWFANTICVLVLQQDYLWSSAINTSSFIAHHCSRRCHVHCRTIWRFSEYIGSNQKVVILVCFPLPGILLLFLRDKYYSWLCLSVCFGYIYMMYFCRILYVMYTSIYSQDLHE